MSAAAGSPLRILMSASAAAGLGRLVDEAVEGTPWRRAEPGEDAHIAFVSREITGLSTKHDVRPETQRFYDGLLNAPSLRWVHLHSAGADRPIYLELHARGVALSTSSGANASVVVQTALAGILSLARHLPQMQAAQRERRWESLVKTGLPRDLQGQLAVVVGWGPIGQGLAALLRMLGLRLVVVRSSAQAVDAATETLAFQDLARVLPSADWLVLACPLTERTRRLVDAKALAALPATSYLVNIARGELVDEDALVGALESGRLAGAYLDVFAHEPLPESSPLWALPNVIATPHSAGHSDGNEKRVAEAFLQNLARWHRGEPLRHLVT